MRSKYGVGRQGVGGGGKEGGEAYPPVHPLLYDFNIFYPIKASMVKDVPVNMTTILRACHSHSIL